MKRKTPKILLEKHRESLCTKVERVLVEKWYNSWKEGYRGKLSDKQLYEAADRIYSKFNFILPK